MEIETFKTFDLHLLILPEVARTFLLQDALLEDKPLLPCNGSAMTPNPVSDSSQTILPLSISDEGEVYITCPTVSILYHKVDFRRMTRSDHIMLLALLYLQSLNMTSVL